MPPAFDRHKRWWGLKPLFYTGNPPPPISFSGEEEFRDFLASKEYRAALCITDVEVGFDLDNNLRDLPHDQIMKCGYTPLGLATNGQNLGSRYRYYSPGVDRKSSAIALGFDYAPVGKFIEFRIGKFGNLMSKLLVGHYAPFACVDISNRIYHDGTYRIEFSGTLVPNQTYYVDWKAVNCYSMENICDENLDDFLTAESRSCTPMRSEHFAVHGELCAVSVG